MHFPGFAGFQHQPHSGACAAADEVMMQSGRCQQSRDRRVGSVNAFIGKDQDRDAVRNRLVRRFKQFLQGSLQTRFPSFGLKRIGSVTDLIPGISILRNFSISEFFRMGSASLSCLQLSGLGSTRLPSDPSVSVVEVINSSRMGSMGGLVTCAKSCLK